MAATVAPRMNEGNQITVYKCAMQRPGDRAGFHPDPLCKLGMSWGCHHRTWGKMRDFT